MPKRVHVLFLDTNDAMGGVVQVHLNLLKHLDRAQFRLSLACQSCGMLVDQFNTIAKVERIPIDAGTKSIKQCRSMKAALYDAVSLTRFWRTVLTLTRYCSKEKVQLIYTSDKKRSVMLATVLSRITGLPFVYHIHNVYVDYRLNRRALRGANAVFANSHAMKAHFVQSLGRGMDRIQVVHNGVDTDVFKPSAGSKLRNYLGLSDAVTVIGVAARLAPEKGHPVLLAAAADLVAEKHHRFHLVIVGDDRIYSNNTGYVQQLQTMVTEASLQDNVTFLGFRKDMSDVYNGLDIVVDPAWEEAFGMVVVEPMACGKTVVGTNAGGIPEIIRDGENGFLFPPGDHGALANILRHLMKNRGLLPKTGAAARATVLREFTIQRQTQALEEVFLTIADSVNGVAAKSMRQSSDIP